jgi:hypothetical protein
VTSLAPLLGPALASALLAALAPGQVAQHTGAPPGSQHYLDFESPPTPTGPISGGSSVFTNAGIASVTQFGSGWADVGDTLTPGPGASGRSLVVTGNGTGVLSIASEGQSLSHCGLGGGFDFTLVERATFFGVLFVDQNNFPYTVELFDGPASLGQGQFYYGEPAPFPQHWWTGPGPFDRVRITFPSSIGVGIDRIAFDTYVAQPTSYCTAGTSTNGCAPTLSVLAQPSLSHANACFLIAGGVEGQRTGLYFYGVDNAGFAPLPWGAGTSWLCVQPPTQRTNSQSSSGTAGVCDGAMTLDWNAWQAAHPTALGQPWGVGDKVYVQAWYRDPPAPKGTNLSDALELTYVP